MRHWVAFRPWPNRPRTYEPIQFFPNQNALYTLGSLVFFGKERRHRRTTPDLLFTVARGGAVRHPMESRDGTTASAGD
jgi:hypothetical protein